MRAFVAVIPESQNAHIETRVTTDDYNTWLDG
jgi:hypothetical protein